MTEQEIVDALTTTLLPSGVAAWLSHFFTRRKVRAETRKSELDNIEQSMKIYQEMISDLKKEYNELKEEVIKLTAELKTAREENALQQLQINRLQNELFTLAYKHNA